MDLVEVELARVISQEKSPQQYIHLREKDGHRNFAIVIGSNEVDEIRRKLCGLETPRPLTHDLVGRVVRALDHRLARVIITELREGTYYANLVLQPADAGPGERLVDCRPSDAIALAVQTGCRIFVAREVMDLVANG